MIRETVIKKAAIKYPAETVLIVQCHPERLILLSEWEQVIEQLRTDPPSHAFREIFLIEDVEVTPGR
jgi:hypothetical protein